MSKKSKKSRANARKAQVRRESGTVLRAVTPPSVEGKVVELKAAQAKASPIISAPSVPDVGVDEPSAERVAPRNAIVPAKLADDAESSSKQSAAARGAGEAGARTTEAPLPEEHRASRRVSLAVDIHLSSESHFFSGLSGDISEGGLFLSTYRALTVGTQVDVEFSLPGSEHPVQARGEVRWIREHSAEQPRGVGIAFEDLSDDDREEIHAFCSSRPPLYYEDVG